MDNNDNIKLYQLYKEKEVKEQIIYELKVLNIPLTNKNIINQFYNIFLNQFTQSKYFSLLYHPLLEEGDRELIRKTKMQNDISIIKYSGILTTMLYTLYFFNRKKWFFYNYFYKNRTNFISKLLFRLNKIIIIPLSLFFINIQLFKYFLDNNIERELKDLGLYKKYYLQNIYNIDNK